MQIVGAFLAEHAEIVDGKLNVTGGVLDVVKVPAVGLTNGNGEQLALPLALVTLMQAGPDDEGRPYRMKLEVVSSNDDITVLGDQEIPGAHLAGENHFWISAFGLTTRTTGRVALIASIEGGGSVSVPVFVERVDRHPAEAGRDDTQSG
ncbi:MAG: hypothetical protein PGN37_14410 [Mycobacterium kyogaense]|uniref:hypothetical protein n=1 Tax=Mycobacterium kyogaense TaxID=2212479 RepID=UPI002FFB3F39